MGHCRHYRATQVYAQVTQRKISNDMDKPLWGKEMIIQRKTTFYIVISYKPHQQWGQALSDAHDYRRNEQVTKAPNPSMDWTHGTDKSNTNTRKVTQCWACQIRDSQCRQGDALKGADSWQKFKNELVKRGVLLEFVYMDKEQTKVQGIRFCKDGYSSRDTQISRDSYGRLDARLGEMENHAYPKSRIYTGRTNCYPTRATMSHPCRNIPKTRKDGGLSSIGLFCSCLMPKPLSNSQGWIIQEKKNPEKASALMCYKHSNNKSKDERELLEAIYGTVERLEQRWTFASPKT